MRRKPTHRRSDGQSLPEFAFVLPIFVALVVGTYDLGRVVWANNVLGSAAREGARFAIVHGGSAITRCPVGPLTLTAYISASSGECGFPLSPSKQAIKDIVSSTATTLGGTKTIYVCYGSGCRGDTDATGATNVRGTPVTVEVTSGIRLVFPSVFGVTSYTLSGKTQMVVNK